VERSELNWRGVVIFGLAVLTVIVLINVIDDDPAQLGAPTVDGAVTTTTLPGTTDTTVAGATVTTKAATGTTKPGTTPTTRAIPATKPTLQNGTSGADVTTVQTILKDLGYYTGAVDGQYGPGTAAAVTAFQTAEGITPITPGAVDAATWNKLATSTTRKAGT
jgi:peptidoglycan hydrolase-like protein with peptidoglycan-binding domain